MKLLPKGVNAQTTASVTKAEKAQKKGCGLLSAELPKMCICHYLFPTKNSSTSCIPTRLNVCHWVVRVMMEFSFQKVMFFFFYVKMTQNVKIRWTVISGLEVDVWQWFQGGEMARNEVVNGREVMLLFLWKGGWWFLYPPLPFFFHAVKLI